MENNFYKKSFLTLLDYSSEDVAMLIKLSAHLKAIKKCRVADLKVLKGHNFALIFEKTSTRTRCSFEVASHQLGASTTYISGGSQMNIKETVKDTARVLGRYYTGIAFRGKAQTTVDQLAAYSNARVWNGLTDEYHPTQIIADLLTMQEHFPNKALKELKVVFFGDVRNNVGISLMIGCAKLGMKFVGCAPEALHPDASMMQKIHEIAKSTEAEITFCTEPLRAVEQAHVLYTDVWVSMGEPAEVWDERVKLLTPYAITAEVMQAAEPDAVFMHCLPAYHNMETEIAKKMGPKYGLTSFEVTEEVFESPQSIVFDEAENRMHTIQAVILATLVEDPFSITN